nr:MBL fold metallo-hydrolase [Petrotoga sp. 9PWA.NaAc.5.4]
MNNNVITLFDNGEHKFIFLGSERKSIESIPTNQYLIIHKEEGVLLDPGGVHVFPRVLASVVEFIDLGKIKHIFYTHQDPDVSSGITLWDTVVDAKFYISKLWERFLPHFGVFKNDKIVPIEDKGGKIKFKDGEELIIIPAHFLHSTGNLILYDPLSKILFSGDIGVSVFPKNQEKIYVENFNEHIKYIEEFHKRYMSSNIACKKLASIIKKYDIDQMVPQHGAIYKKQQFNEFLKWFENIKCGIDLIDSIYGNEK